MRCLLIASTLVLTACGGSGEEERGALNVEDRALANRIEDLAALEKNEAEAAVPEPASPLEPISYEDVAKELKPGAGCDLSVDGRFLLVAVTGDAIVKTRGRIVHLKQDGSPAETGGFFRGEGLSVSVGRIGADRIIVDETARWPAEAAVRRAGDEKPVTIAGTWRCGA
ncbi:hypothetical protein [Allosphingosinicella vermicomposti]|uniref:hypothetical protein n=1 Tax=Allosphingosinicella vermicomposti TaxID=614671 RepID=UPI000D113F5C|nr:hypothetical protein [Allosphingosinicella vermicomposti]